MFHYNRLHIGIVIDTNFMVAAVVGVFTHCVFEDTALLQTDTDFRRTLS